MIDVQYMINYTVLAAFLTLFIAEIGSSFIFLINRQYYPRIKNFITPLWGPIGTFAIFYAVNTEATYPSALSLVGTMYIALGMAAGLFFILRNAFIMYSEAHSNKRMDLIYRELYIVMTVIVAFLVVTIFSSAISGIGVNLSQDSINALTAMFNPFNVAYFISIALMALSVSYVQFNVREGGRIVPLVSAALSYIIIVAVSEKYLPYFAPALASNYYVLAISLIIAAVGFVAYFLGKSISKYIMGIWLFVSIDMFGVIQYPHLFGTATEYTKIINKSKMSLYASYVTAIGGFLVALYLVIFFYVNYLKRVS
jgi:cytochrome bd-type quinol oxidase subunit 2